MSEDVYFEKKNMYQYVFLLISYLLDMIQILCHIFSIIWETIHTAYERHATFVKQSY